MIRYRTRPRKAPWRAVSPVPHAARVSPVPARPTAPAPDAAGARPATRGVVHVRCVPSAVALQTPASGAGEARRWAPATPINAPAYHRSVFMVQ